MQSGVVGELEDMEYDWNLDILKFGPFWNLEIFEINKFLKFSNS